VDDSTNKTFTIDELAEYIRTPREVIREWVKDDKIPHEIIHSINGTTLYFSKRNIDALFPKPLNPVRGEE